MGLRDRIKGLLFRRDKKPPVGDIPKPGEVVRQTGRPKPPPERYRTTKAPERPKRGGKPTKPEAAPTEPAASKPAAELPAGLPQDEAQAIDKTRRAVLRAKRGSIKYLIENDGVSPLAELHDNSERRFFIAHRAFSRLMEEMTGEGLVDFDHGSGVAKLTDAGRTWLDENPR